ncbi:unnamed protein product [Paramecium octaurelia]|uniref:Uncharacterized protein n=1 Tax=Paramecium octaurelia TaxID=43137 RepID=A0A8S1XPG4_PAROT|nr:unnamed protein product [Paramecium octaurelia]
MQQKQNQAKIRNALQQQLFPKMQKKIEQPKTQPKSHQNRRRKQTINSITTY